MAVIFSTSLLEGGTVVNYRRKTHSWLMHFNSSNSSCSIKVRKCYVSQSSNGIVNYLPNFNHEFEGNAVFLSKNKS